MRRRTVLVGAATLAVTAGIGDSVPALGKSRVDGPRNIALHRWAGAAGFAAGTADGVTVDGDALVMDAPAGTIEYTDPYGSGTAVSYEYATWTGPSVSPGFGLTELISSWDADTPGGSWLQMEMRGTGTGWYVLGRWAAGDGQLHRTSVDGQSDSTGEVDVDTFRAAKHVSLDSWQLRLTLYRPAGATETPAVRMVCAVATALPSGTPTASSPGPVAGTVLDVPGYSQQIHSGEYPQWNGGGEAWCSATSTAMILGWWGTGPTPDEYSWVDPSYPDPWVDHAVRNVFDYSYGAGNWPFNTAYAARYGLDGFVTRLRSLTEAEAFIGAGIPLAVSASFSKGQIPGLDYGTAGHLMVLVGFADDGSPVINDPNSADDASVRKPVGRPEFEAAWLTSSGGTVYVIHPSTTPLPPVPTQANW